MKWSDTERALGNVFLHASGLKTTWLAQKDAVRCNPQGRMQIRSVRGVGQDFKQYNYDADRNKLTSRIEGVRRFVWSVSVESTGAKPGESAWVYIENFRTNLISDKVSSILNEFRIDVSSVGESTIIAVGDSDRMVMRATVDVVLYICISDADCPVDFIETVILDSNFYDVDGTLLSSDTIEVSA